MSQTMTVMMKTLALIDNRQLNPKMSVYVKRGEWKIIIKFLMLI